MRLQHPQPAQSSQSAQRQPELTERQQVVLRALVAAYVATVAPVGSGTISHVIPLRLSSASIRNTLAELSDLGLVTKPHASSGRIPTDEGLRIFVDRLLERVDIAREQRRDLDLSFGQVEPDGAARLASQLLSDYTRQLGFVLLPRLERVVLSQVSFVRLSTERLLAVLVTESGHAHQCVIEVPSPVAQPELDRMAATLNERIAGRTLREARDRLRAEIAQLRSDADRLVARALRLGLRLADTELGAPAAGDLVIATRLALLDQPEFGDPQRLRELFGAVEEGERLLELVDEVLRQGRQGGVSVALGDDLERQGLGGFALVAAPYADSAGVLGVIGPSRMDYARIIPLVDYTSQLVGEKLAGSSEEALEDPARGRSRGSSGDSSGDSSRGRGNT